MSSVLCFPDIGLTSPPNPNIAFGSNTSSFNTGTQTALLWCGFNEDRQEVAFLEKAEEEQQPVPQQSWWLPFNSGLAKGTNRQVKFLS